MFKQVGFILKATVKNVDFEGKKTGFAPQKTGFTTEGSSFDREKRDLLNTIQQSAFSNNIKEKCP